MDLNRQIGSLFIVGFPGTRITAGAEIVRDIQTYGLGGVILFNRCLHDPRQKGNIGPASELSRLTATLQGLGPEPLLICVDQEGGAVQRLGPDNGFPAIPAARQMAAQAEDTSETRRHGEETAAVLAGMGITVNFAPVVDVDRRPNNPIIGRLGRSFSASPRLVAAHAAAWITAHRRHGIISCVKHFPGHGSSSTDSHCGFVDISTSWHVDELHPYRALLEANLVDMVMTGHLFNQTIDPVYPATLSPSTVTGLLRNELGYQGVVISDDLQMQAISAHYRFEDALCRALAAGVDLLVIGNNLVYRRGIVEQAVAAIRNGIDRGLVTKTRVLEAYHRVQQLKNGSRKDN
jgi:beta-N-acetylhexosaminidase